MSTPTQTQAPDTLPANYFDQSSAPQQTAQGAPQGAQAPDTLPADYFDQQGQTPTPEAPKMVTQGHDRFGNVIRIPEKDTAGSLVGPLAIPVVGAAIGAAPEVAGAAGSALSNVMPFAEHISTQIAEHGAELAEKYPNFVKLASKIVPSLPFSGLAALTWAYEHFKK